MSWTRAFWRHTAYGNDSASRIPLPNLWFVPRRALATLRCCKKVWMWPGHLTSECEECLDVRVGADTLELIHVMHNVWEQRGCA